MRTEIPRLLIAGSGSGSGKTTLSCALLLGLKGRGMDLAAFKCGPDYIDPMFHSRVLGVKSSNLDIFMSGEDSVKSILGENAAGQDLALIEGVMGLYDGLGSGDYASSNHLATLTGTPTVLVLNTRGQSLSLAAQLLGYLNFLPNTVKGVILSQTSQKMHVFFKDMLEERLGIRVYGYLPPLPEVSFGSRQLGLIMPHEIADFERKLEVLTEACERCVDIDGLLKLAATAEPLEYEPSRAKAITNLKISVAYDPAFCFYYEDNFEQLRALGAYLEFFSPLEEPELPGETSGLLIGGGYPEEYAAALSGNRSMLASIRAAGERGLPIFAECGGFMYLCHKLTDKLGTSYPMVGLVDTVSRMTNKLGPFGYINITAEQDSFLCSKGAELRAHEFHYSESDEPGSAFTARKADGRSWPCIQASAPGGGLPPALGTADRRRIFAGYPHFHFRGNPGLAEGFVRACQEYTHEVENG